MIEMQESICHLLYQTLFHVSSSLSKNSPLEKLEKKLKRLQVSTFTKKCGVSRKNGQKKNTSNQQKEKMASSSCKKNPAFSPSLRFCHNKKNKSKSQQNWSQTQLIARGAHFPFRRAFRSVFSLSFLNCFFKVDFLASVKSTPDPDRSVVFFWLVESFSVFFVVLFRWLVSKQNGSNDMTLM